MILDNNGYSINNDMNQGAANNLNQIQPQKESRNTKVIFIVGLFTGVIISTLMASAVYVGVRIADVLNRNAARPASAEGTFADSVVNDDTIAKLESIEKVIEEYYYKEEDINTNDMIEGMYEGLVASLGDPYSEYYTADDWEALMMDSEGLYIGIGAYVSMDEKTACVKISGVMPDSPAQEAGLREEDLIYKVDGEIVQGMSRSEVVAMLKDGAEGTTVHLTIYREGETDYLEVDVIRRQIESPTVTYEMLENEIGYIRITEFDTITTEQFKEALAVIKGSGAAGLILDLRGNPGGSLSVVIDIARQILPEGLIVYTENRAGERTEYSCNGENELQIPLVVLVNGYSASASEILAGAIKDHNKGILLGTTTFGKGIVQRILPLTDGTALKLTVSAYYTPNGNNIHEIGIEPDIECQYDSDTYYEKGIDNQLEEAKKEIAKMLG